VHGYATRWIFSFNFGQYTIVFQGEVYAIKACVVENLDRIHRIRNVYILLDSQAAIRTLSNHQIT
jgi:hypothetical protein